MLVIAMETGSLPDGRMRWAGRRHDDDRPDASSGSSSAELFDAVFHALHDGEQVALGFDCPLTMPAPPGQDPPADADALVTLAEPAAGTSLGRWKANTSILVWQAVSAPGAAEVAAGAAADSFFRQFPAATKEATDTGAGTVLNLAAAAARSAGLFVDASELARPTVSITVTGG